MVLDQHYHRLDQVKSWMSTLVYPLQWAVHAPSTLSQDVKEYFVSHHHLVQENKRLKQEQFLQNGQLQQLISLQAENTRLRTLLQSSERQKEEHTIAEVLQIDEDPFNHRIVLNKGIDSKVLVGQPIIDEDGVMGEVIEVNPCNSVAILVTDASHAVPVENARNGVRGILLGTGAIDTLSLQHVPTTADIQEGDVLVTSGLGGRYPPGYPVGVINKVEHDPAQTFAVIRVKPKAHLERGRQVLLVQTQNQAQNQAQTQAQTQDQSQTQTQPKIGNQNIETHSNMEAKPKVGTQPNVETQPKENPKP